MWSSWHSGLNLCPAWAGRFFTTVPPGSPLLIFLNKFLESVCWTADPSAAYTWAKRTSTSLKSWIFIQKHSAGSHLSAKYFALSAALNCSHECWISLLSLTLSTVMVVVSRSLSLCLLLPAAFLHLCMCLSVSYHLMVFFISRSFQQFLLTFLGI